MKIIMGEIPNLSYSEQLPYSRNYAAMFMLLCFTKAMNIELFSEKHWEKELNSSSWFPRNSYGHLGRQKIPLSDSKWAADVCQKEEAKSLFQLSLGG